MRQCVLILHKNTDFCNVLKEKLHISAIETVIAHDLDETIQLYFQNDFSLVIMDAIMSNADGHRLLKIMRTVKVVPILLLSADNKPSDRTAALEAGATAYIYCPYQVEECVAQSKSLLAFYSELKQKGEEAHPLAYGTHLIINQLKRQVYVNEAPVRLTRKEFDLLFCLAKHPGHVFTREQLYQQVWGMSFSYNVDDVVKAHIKTLRKKLSDTGKKHIQNVWGVGYRFEPE